MAWLKPFTYGWRGGAGGIQYSWEPVIVKESPAWATRRARHHVVRDICLDSPPLVGFPGAKPTSFCYWLFDVLGLVAGDEFVDIFPGSGRVTLAWQSYVNRGNVPLDLVHSDSGRGTGSSTQGVVSPSTDAPPWTPQPNPQHA